LTNRLRELEILDQ